MLQWKKKPGEAVAQDEILIEIETDKVVLEVPAPSAGVLAEIVVADGGMVVSDQVIAKIDSEGKAGAAAPAAAPAAAAAAPAVAAAAAPVAAGGAMAGAGLRTRPRLAHPPVGLRTPCRRGQGRTDATYLAHLIERTHSALALRRTRWN